MEVEPSVGVVKPHIIEIPAQELPVQNVTIYHYDSHCAKVKRLINLNVPKGDTEVRITNFRPAIFWSPRKFASNNCSISLDGPDQKFVRSCRIKYQNGTSLEDFPEVATARRKYNELNRQTRSLQDDKFIVKNRIAAFDCMIYQAASENMESIEKVQDNYGIETKKLQIENVRLNEQIGDADREMKAALKELQLAEENNSNLATILISLDSPGGALELHLNSIVDNASWFPKYNVYVDTSCSPPSLEVQYMAELTIEGDEFANASVTLIRGEPSYQSTLPMLNSKEVRLEANGRTSNSESKPDEEEETPTAQKRMKPQPKMEFVLPAPLTIRRVKEEELFHDVEIGSFKAEPILTHRCVPSQKEAVFLTAQITNNSGLTLLPGNVSVFLNGSLAQEYSLGESVEPGEKFRVNLGEDSLVKVTYPEARQTSVEGGYLSYETSKVTEQEIVIKNNRSEPVQLELKEAVPKSEDGRIKVTLLSPEPLNTSPRPTDSSSVGIWLSKDKTLDWTVSVNPAEEKTLLVKYSISFPIGESLVIGDSE